MEFYNYKRIQLLIMNIRFLVKIDLIFINLWSYPLSAGEFFPIKWIWLQPAIETSGASFMFQMNFF